MTMPVQTITLGREEARVLWRKYQEHRHYSGPLDREIESTYRAISQGRVVIKALESVRLAGLGADRLPKLAIVRADATLCYINTQLNGAARMSMTRRQAGNETRTFIDFSSGTFPGINSDRWLPQAMVPLIPVPVRPRRGLANYHILFEAEWTKVVPKDPMLLRRIGKGDLWTVLATWDLTDVERQVLAQRLNG